MSDSELKQFIKAMDKDGDGAIDFEEWRDFLVVSGSSLVLGLSPSQSGTDLVYQDIPIVIFGWSDTPNMAQKDDMLVEWTYKRLPA